MPVIIHVSSTTISFENKEVKLVCKAINYVDTDILRIQIVWYDPSGKLINTDQDIIYSGNGFNRYENVLNSTAYNQVESTLWIDMVQHADSGVYTCRAFNHPQFFVEEITKLIVECEIHISK